MEIKDIVTMITGIIGCITGVSSLVIGLIRDMDKPKIWFEDNRFLKPENPLSFKDPANLRIQKKSVAIATIDVICNNDVDTGNVSSISESKSRVGILNYSDDELTANDTYTKERPLISIFTFKNLGGDAQAVIVHKVKVIFPDRTETLYPDQNLGASFDEPILRGQSIKVLFGYFFMNTDKNKFIPMDNYALMVDERAKKIPDNMFGIEMPDPVEKYTKFIIYFKIASTKGHNFKQRIIVKFANGKYIRETI